MEPLDYCSNFLIGGYNSDGSTRLYSLVEEDELLASIRGRIMKKIALINPPFRGVIHRIIKSKGIDIVLQLSKDFQHEKFVIKETWGNALPCTQKEIEARHNVTIEKIESDFSKIYCNCKLLLLPSQEAEGLGRGSVEASLNSVPILASNNGGIPEAVKINDFLIFDYSNYASWRNALEKLFDPTIFAIHCQKALENAIAYERRYLNNSFSEYIDSILGQKKRYKSLNN